MSLWHTVRCGRCFVLFSFDASRGVPQIAYCPRCEFEVNRMIDSDVALKTGRVTGSVNDTRKDNHG